MRHAATLTAPTSYFNVTDVPFPEPLSPDPLMASGGSNLPNVDPASIEFISLDKAHDIIDDKRSEDSLDALYPFVNMLRGSARYIADHRGETCVFYVPGDMLKHKGFDKLMDDLALAWLLGLKIVIVVGCHYDVECCALGFKSGHECRNTLRVTDDKLLRNIEEDAGYVRFEVERQLNRCLNRHGGMSQNDKNSPLPQGNVVGGNFYTAKPFGVVRGTDYQNTGYPSHVHDEKINEVLARDDIVLLTTVGSSRLGSCVNVNGNHLAASVASALGAHKLVYFSTTGSVLRKKGEDKTLQDVPVSVAKSILDHHKVQVHKAGFASFKEASKRLEPSAVELLLHMGWASWALDQGVKRAHIVNPGDGAVLEELFTAKHGANTCLYHDNESDEFSDDMDLDDILDSMLPDNQDEILFSELPSM